MWAKEAEALQGLSLHPILRITLSEEVSVSSHYLREKYFVCRSDEYVTLEIGLSTDSYAVIVYLRMKAVRLERLSFRSDFSCIREADTTVFLYN